MHKYRVNHDTPLGVGGEGKVLEVSKASGNSGEGETFVMKQRMCFTLEDANSGLSEALALARFQQNPNIVAFEDIFIHLPTSTTSISSSGSENHYFICIVMEHCTGGNLLDYLLHYDTQSTTSPRSSTTFSTFSDPNPRLTTSYSAPTSSSVTNPRNSTSLAKSDNNSSASKPIFTPNVSISPPASPTLELSTISNITIVDKEFLPREFIIEWMRQMCTGVQAIHAAKLVHRDLKSENIFLSNNNVLKIGDFGLAALHKNEKVKGAAGTYYYSCPELLRDKLYDRSGDIFSLGCIFYEMATLNLLPVTRTCFGDEILKGTFNHQKTLAEFPDDCKDIGALVLQMLQGEPSMRPMVDTILRNPIFATQKIEKIPDSLQKFYNTSGSSLHGIIIRQLLVSDGNAFAETMARAYANEPLFFAVVNRPTNREEVLRALFKTAFKFFQTKRFSVWGLFNTNRKLLATSVWVPPDSEERKPSLKEILHVAFSSKIVMTVGLNAIRRFKKQTQRINDIIKDRDCWHLLYVGVEPEHQNRKLGETLCQPVLHWADQEGTVTTACLFGERPAHFLQKMGFVVDKIHKPEKEKELTCWYYKRVPQGKK